MPSGIRETTERFSIEWNATYTIDGEIMAFTDNLGRQWAVFGYPVTEIMQAVRRMGR